jgi:hypothetical protein
MMIFLDVFLLRANALRKQLDILIAFRFDAFGGEQADIQGVKTREAYCLVESFKWLPIFCLNSSILFVYTHDSKCALSYI